MASAPRSVDVAIVGDSLAQYWSSEKLSSLFPSKTVLNVGLASDRTQNVLWRLADPGFTLLSPKLVIVLVGVNNLLDGAAPCGIAAGTIAVLQQIRSIWPGARIIVADIAASLDGYTFREADRRAANELTRKALVGVPNLDILEIDRKLTDGIEYQSNWLSTSIRFPPFHLHSDKYMDDDLHFSPAGYDVVGNLLLQILQKESTH